MIRRWLCRRFGHRPKWLPLPGTKGDKIELCGRCGRVLCHEMLSKVSENGRGPDYYRAFDVEWPPRELWERDTRLDR